MTNDWYVKENGGKGNLVGIASKSSSWFIAEEVLPEHAPLIAAAQDLLHVAEMVERAMNVKDAADRLAMLAALGELAKAAIAKATAKGK